MFDGVATYLRRTIGGLTELTDEDLQEKFTEIDVDSNGVLSKDEIVEVLRKLGKCDDDIENITTFLADGATLDFDAFRDLMNERQFVFDRKLVSEHVLVSSNGLSVKHRGRPDDLFGVIFTNAPIQKIEEDLWYFEICIDSVLKGQEDGLAIGITNRKPSSFNEKFEAAEEVPASWSFGYNGQACLKGKKDMIDINWYPSNLKRGDRVGLMIDAGLVHIFENGEIVYESPAEVRTDVDYYPFVDLLGATRALSIVAGAIPPPPEQEVLAARKIQAAQRGKIARREYAKKREKLAKKHAQEDAVKKLEASARNHAASKIQARQRGNVARKEVAMKRSEAESAQEDDVHDVSGSKIQAAHRGNVALEETAVETSPSEATCDEAAAQHKAALKIQAIHRGNLARHGIVTKRHEAELARQEVAAGEMAASKIQAVQRGKFARQEVARKRFGAEAAKDDDVQEDAGAQTQTDHRGSVAFVETAVEKLPPEAICDEAAAQHKAALKIQAIQRGNVARQDVVTKRHEAELARQQVAAREMAASKIQAIHRGNFARQEVSTKKHEAEVARQEVAAREMAALTLQAMHRGNVARQAVASKKHEDELTRQKVAAREMAAMKIQAFQRGKVARQEVAIQREHKSDGGNLMDDAAATKPQEDVASASETTDAATNSDVFVLWSKAATTLQAMVRGRLVRKEVEESKREKDRMRGHMKRRGFVSERRLSDLKLEDSDESCESSF